MNLDLSLNDIGSPRFSDSLIKQPIKILDEISIRNQRKFEQGHETPKFQNRKIELIKRLKLGSRSGETFEEITDIVGIGKIKK
jgi:hypothetical protein